MYFEKKIVYFVIFFFFCTFEMSTYILKDLGVSKKASLLCVVPLVPYYPNFWKFKIINSECVLNFSALSKTACRM